MTQEEHDNFYGYTSSMTPEERQARTREIMRTAKYYGDIDEDTVDSEAMKGSYNDEAYEDYKNEAVQTLNAR